MSGDFAVGIDIGTYHVKVAITKRLDQNQSSRKKRSAGQIEADSTYKIIGTGHAESKGMRYGYIISLDEVKASLEHAIAMAEQSAKVNIREANLGVGGVSLDSVVSSGSVIVSRGDGEVSAGDIDRLYEVVENNLPAPEIVNKKIIHTIPQQYFLDGKPLTGSPIGLTGVKLEARSLFVTCFEQHLNDLVDVVESLGIKVNNVVASPLAAGLITLSPTQKIAGCVLANIGSETVTVVVYEDNLPISLTVLPIGSSDITNDLALGLKIPLENAESIKHGSLGASSGLRVSKKKIGDIISARLTDIFELIKAHLKKIKRDGILPAGVVITGGGSSLHNIEGLAKDVLELPAKTANLNLANNQSGIRDASWSVVYGLGVLGLSDDDTIGLPNTISETTLLGELFYWFKQFLP
jgi:cell division protein FtsA